MSRLLHIVYCRNEGPTQVVHCAVVMKPVFWSERVDILVNRVPIGVAAFSK